MGNINIKRYKRGAHIAIADSILNAMNECLGVQLLWVLARVPPLRLAKNSNCCSDYLVLEPRRFLSIHHTKRESNYLPLSFFVPCVCSCWFPSAALFFIRTIRPKSSTSGHPFFCFSKIPLWPVSKMSLSTICPSDGASGTGCGCH